MSPDPRVALAVADSAAWCTSVCRSLGRTVRATSTLWSADDPPRWYPHRATLSPEVGVDDVVVAGLPAEASVKDAFARLDLSGHGFVPLLDASWLHRRAGVAGDSGWSVVRTGDELAAWADASGTAGVVTAPLLADPAVALLLVHDAGRPVGGAALSSAAAAVGVSNVFGDEERTWRVVVAAAAVLHPGRDLVGYETDPAPATAAGLTTVGPLRVWQRG